jgi:hypothetical protein
MIYLKTIVGKVALSGIICILTLPCITLQVEAANPAGTTHQFYGTVSGSGGLVGAGYTVTAMVNGQQVASATTDSHGQWGYSPLFVVTASSNTNIEFYVNGVLAGTAAGCISTNRMELVYNAPPLSPVSTGTETVTAGAISSGGTTTFFIGKQPTGTSPAKTTTPEKTQTVAAPPVTSVAVIHLSALPQVAEADEDVNVTVRLLNKGNTEFTGGVVLKVNDIVEQQKDVTIAINEAGTINFQVNRSEPGNYQATVDDYSTDFIVKERQAVDISQSRASPDATAQQANAGAENKLLPDNPWLVLAVIAVGLILAIYLISLIVRQGSSRY